jgi:hypothetical protein
MFDSLVKNWKPCLFHCLMIRMSTVLLRSHLIPLHILINIKYLIHLNKQQQQLLGETVLQLHLQQPQNKPCPTHDNQLETPYLNQFHKPQSMTQRRSLKCSLNRLHRLNSFLTLLSRLHAIWILLTCELLANITLRHNIGIKWIWKNKLDA